MEMETNNTLFPGETDVEQLSMITRFCGLFTREQLESMNNNLGKISTYGPKEIEELLKEEAFFNLIYILRNKYPKCNHKAIDFANQCLRMDPKKRSTAEALLCHCYFLEDNFAVKYFCELMEKIDKEVKPDIVLEKHSNKIKPPQESTEAVGMDVCRFLNQTSVPEGNNKNEYEEKMVSHKKLWENNETEAAEYKSEEKTEKQCKLKEKPQTDKDASSDDECSSSDVGIEEEEEQSAITREVSIKEMQFSEFKKSSVQEYDFNKFRTDSLREDILNDYELSSESSSDNFIVDFKKKMIKGREKISEKDKIPMNFRKMEKKRSCLEIFPKPTFKDVCMFEETEGERKEVAIRALGKKGKGSSINCTCDEDNETARQLKLERRAQRELDNFEDRTKEYFSSNTKLPTMIDSTEISSEDVFPKGVLKLNAAVGTLYQKSSPAPKNEKKLLKAANKRNYYWCKNTIPKVMNEVMKNVNLRSRLENCKTLGIKDLVDIQRMISDECVCIDCCTITEIQDDDEYIKAKLNSFNENTLSCSDGQSLKGRKKRFDPLTWTPQ